MIVGAERSGLIEASHPVVAAAVDGSGMLIETIGVGPDRPFFYRSAIKPLQAAVSVRNGADLEPEQLALASASHAGQPVHVAIVRRMLLDVGLEAEHLRCPPDRPTSRDADVRLASSGHTAKDRMLHNCSGKHAGMLRACRARDWSYEYTEPDHPLQREIVESVTEWTGVDATPVGVDGCGVPTLRGHVVGLARGFARLATDPELRPIAETAARFSSLTSDGDRPEATIARWFPGPVKGGAMGCVGAAWLEGGIGLAAKCWTGQSQPAIVALLTLMDRLGILPAHPAGMLAPLAAPPVLGGGQAVGSLVLEEAP